MIHIRLNEAIFNPTTGKEPFKSMTAQQQVKFFYTIESSGSEIGIIPFSPPLNRDARRKPSGQNSSRTLNISRNPLSFDETIINKNMMQNQGYLFNRIISAIADGIIIATKDASSTPITAVEFSTLVFGA